MVKSEVKCSDCGDIFTVAFEPVVGRPLYCPECFFRNFEFKSNNYLNQFISRLSENLGLQKGSKIDFAREGFLYQILLKEKGTSQFVCIMELIPTAEPQATAKFIVTISAKGSKVQNIEEYIHMFQVEYGLYTEIPLTPLRRF